MDRNDWKSYKKARNKVTQETRKTKNDFYKNAFEKLAEEKDIKKTFKKNKQSVWMDQEFWTKMLPEGWKHLKETKRTCEYSTKLL